MRQHALPLPCPDLPELSATRTGPEVGNNQPAKVVAGEQQGGRVVRAIRRDGPRMPARVPKPSPRPRRARDQPAAFVGRPAGFGVAPQERPWSRGPHTIRLPLPIEWWKKRERASGGSRELRRLASQDWEVPAKCMNSTLRPALVPVRRVVGPGQLPARQKKSIRHSVQILSCLALVYLAESDLLDLLK